MFDCPRVFFSGEELEELNHYPLVFTFTVCELEAIAQSK
jgi:hypothetical protein